MLFTLLAAASLLMLAGLYSLASNLLLLRAESSPKNWKRLCYGSLCAGLVFALSSWLGTFWMLLPYPNIAGDGWFAGLPFMAVYVDSNENYYDFSFTQASVVANGIFWFLIPMACLHMYARYWHRLQAKAG